MKRRGINRAQRQKASDVSLETERESPLGAGWVERDALLMGEYGSHMRFC
jgi:hypothetical protein